MYEGDVRADLASRIGAAVTVIKTAARYMPRTFQDSHLPILMVGVGPGTFLTDDIDDSYGSEVLSVNRDMRLLFLAAKLTMGSEGDAERKCEEYMHALHQFLFSQQRFVTTGSNQSYTVRLVSDAGIQNFRFAQEQNAPEYIGVETLVSARIDTLVQDTGV